MRGVITTLIALISAAPAAADLMGSSVRGDYVTDQKLYPETCCANKGGGRVSLVLSATGGYAFNGTRAGSYPLTVVIAGDNDVASTVELKGDGDASFSDSSGGLDWCHADVDGALGSALGATRTPLMIACDRGHADGTWALGGGIEALVHGICSLVGGTWGLVGRTWGLVGRAWVLVS